MTDNPRKIVGLFATLLAAWVVVFWMYPASRPAVTYGEPPPGFVAPAPTPLTQMDTPAARPQPRVNPPAIEPKHESAPMRVVEKPRFRDYTVKKGDVSFEAIAARPDVFGNAKFARVIAEANPLVSPKKLIVGRTVLRIPLDPDNVQGKLVTLPSAPAPAPKTEPAPTKVEKPATPPVKVEKPTLPAEKASEIYIVQAGDTLSKIAKVKYGKSALWEFLLEANKDVLDDPGKLREGMKITIPPKPAE